MFLTIWGLCPKCNVWFRADDWFDTSVPLPTCPMCGMSPSRIEYERVSWMPQEDVRVS